MDFPLFGVSCLDLAGGFGVPVSSSFDSIEVSVILDLLLNFLAATVDLLLPPLDFLLTSPSGLLIVLESLDLLPSLDFWLDFVDAPFDLLDVAAPLLQIEVKI